MEVEVHAEPRRRDGERHLSSAANSGGSAGPVEAADGSPTSAEGGEASRPGPEWVEAAAGTPPWWAQPAADWFRVVLAPAASGGGSSGPKPPPPQAMTAPSSASGKQSPPAPPTNADAGSNLTTAGSTASADGVPTVPWNLVRRRGAIFGRLTSIIMSMAVQVSLPCGSARRPAAIAALQRCHPLAVGSPVPVGPSRPAHPASRWRLLRRRRCSVGNCRSCSCEPGASRCRQCIYLGLWHPRHARRVRCW